MADKKTLTTWYCIPCTTTNLDTDEFCCICGRDRASATNRKRWRRFLRSRR